MTLWKSRTVEPAPEITALPQRIRRPRPSLVFQFPRSYTVGVLITLLVLNVLEHLPRAAAQDIYAPFSGAIYIVGADGVQITQASPAYCPQYAALSCSGIGYPNWCCPTDHTCQYISTSNVVGCCPAGSTCSGTVNAQSISTVTVTIIQTQTQYVGGGYVQPTTTTAYVGAAGNNNNNNNDGGAVYAGYCSTLTADGPGLPTTRAGSCGIILIVSDAWRGTHGGRGWYGWGVPVAVVANVFLGAWLAGARRVGAGV